MEGTLRTASLVRAVIAVLCCVPGPARAQVEDPPAAGSAEAGSGSTAADAEARARFEAGRIAYAAARYDDALDDFEHAYALSGRAELLFNMGQCLDRLRRDAEAIDAFERYLAERPEAGNREEVEGRLEVLRAAEAERAAGRAPTPEPEPEVTPAPAGGIETEWWLWTLIGVAVVGIGVGIGVGVATSTPSTSPPIAGDVGPGGVVTALVGSW
jgi:hypothetical protein